MPLSGLFWVDTGPIRRWLKSLFTLQQFQAFYFERIAVGVTALASTHTLSRVAETQSVARLYQVVPGMNSTVRISPQRHRWHSSIPNKADPWMINCLCRNDNLLSYIYFR